MIDTPQIRPTIAGKIWITVRFILFGMGGFVTVWVSWWSIMFAFDPPAERLLSPFVAIPLSLVGALMMLYGGGQWGRWAYLWVFVSVPLVVAPVAWLAEAYPAAEWLFAKPILIMLFALPMPVSYLLVKKYYRRGDNPVG
jgi:lysylphosphatidylglycerol synthetase-like protein (DUF2156 family)